MAQSCINLGLAKSLVLKICEISRSSFYYKPKLEAKKVGRVFSKTTQKITGEYDENELVIEHIKTLLAEPFVDYGYLKVTYFLRDEKNYIINPKKVYRLMHANSLLCTEKGTREFTKRQWVKELVPKPIKEFTYFEFDIKYIYIQGKKQTHKY